jgi:uncharacterized metal-binding protein YceD (DUF177 family)
MTDTTDNGLAGMPLTEAFRTGSLGNRKPTRFDLKPDAAARARVAQYLDITAIPNLRFVGEIRPKGRHDFTLEAVLEATVEQPCAITLDPVITRLKEDVSRVYLADWTMPEGDEMQMPEDDTVEALGEVIDAGHVAVEALALALPPFPRAPGAVLGAAQFTAPGQAPLRDGDLKPFSGLAALKAKLESGQDGSS